MLESKFKNDNSFEKRVAISKTIIERHPNKVPVFVSPTSDKEPSIENNKYIIPSHYTMQQLKVHFMSQIKAYDYEAITFMVNGKMISSSQLLSQIYQNDKDVDGFLYIKYCKESVFG